jgi:hypothetical protein
MASPHRVLDGAYIDHSPGTHLEFLSGSRGLRWRRSRSEGPTRGALLQGANRVRSPGVRRGEGLLRRTPQLETSRRKSKTESVSEGKVRLAAQHPGVGSSSARSPCTRGPRQGCARRCRVPRVRQVRKPGRAGARRGTVGQMAKETEVGSVVPAAGAEGQRGRRSSATGAGWASDGRYVASAIGRSPMPEKTRFDFLRAALRFGA